MATTATGIDAETVMPTFMTKYNDDAAKINPNAVPVTSAGIVNSFGLSLAGT